MMQPGDCVIVNAATSTVGQAVIQLCATLQLRTVAVACDHGSFDRTALWLKSLGATQVLADKGSIKASKPRLFLHPPFRPHEVHYLNQRNYAVFVLFEKIEDTGLCRLN